MEWLALVRTSDDLCIVLESKMFLETEAFVAEDAIDDLVALEDPLLSRVASERDQTDLFARLYSSTRGKVDFTQFIAA